MTQPTVTYILTDIEGTTSDIAFVKEVLFPYAAAQLPSFIRAQHASPEVAEQLRAAAGELGCEAGDLEALITGLLSWIEQDLKKTALKALQGQVWRYGYQAGDFKGHLYEDAHERLQAWAAAGLSLGVYSSGSVEAQRLLFGYSEYGDLTGLFSDHFDTKIGHKREQAAYQRIAQALIGEGRVEDPSEVLFLSDVVEELDAARGAGMKTAELRRDGQPGSAAHPVFEDFNQVESHYLR